MNASAMQHYFSHFQFWVVPKARLLKSLDNCIIVMVMPIHILNASDVPLLGYAYRGSA
jgi:hypothetical protein